MGEEEKYHRETIDKLKMSGTEEDLALIEIVCRAEFSDHWGCCEGEVIIGRSGDISEFATLLFHESGHKYLNLSSSIEEEKECYLFSRKVCQRLGIEFNSELERHGLNFINLPKTRESSDEFEKRVNEIPEHFLVLLSLLPQAR